MQGLSSSSSRSRGRERSRKQRLAVLFFFCISFFLSFFLFAKKLIAGPWEGERKEEEDTEQRRMTNRRVSCLPLPSMEVSITALSGREETSTEGDSLPSVREAELDALA